MWNNSNNSMQEGGFMDTTVNSFSNDKTGNSNRKAQNCVPLMIAQINRHGENLQIYGAPVKIAMIMAIVTKIEAVSTKVLFDFKDESGEFSSFTSNIIFVCLFFFVFCFSQILTFF